MHRIIARLGALMQISNERSLTPGEKTEVQELEGKLQALLNGKHPKRY